MVCRSVLAWRAYRTATELVRCKPVPAPCTGGLEACKREPYKPTRLQRMTCGWSAMNGSSESGVPPA